MDLDCNCNPQLSSISPEVPNTLIEGHIPWFRDPKPKGTNPKGTKYKLPETP